MSTLSTGLYRYSDDPAERRAEIPVWLMPSVSDRRATRRGHSSDSRKRVGFLGIGLLS